MINKHAIMSPSAASRWLHCTAAPMLEAHVPDISSEYADEGTLAHAIGARMLMHSLGRSHENEDAEIERLADFRTPEMEIHARYYHDLVIERYQAAKAEDRDAVLLVETKLDMEDIIPECYGTADAMIVTRDRIEVIDLKYGKGVEVSAVDNPQMMLYALGALSYYELTHNIKRASMTIVQPRLDNVSYWETSADALRQWAEQIARPAALEALYSSGKQMPGKWCRFCRAKCVCNALADLSLDTYGKYSDTTIDKSTMEKLLPMLPMIKAWVSKMEDYALEQALGGVNYDGYKLVEGRSVRRITDPGAVMGELAKRYEFDQFVKPRELRTITEIEKLMGRKAFAEVCGQWIEKPQGKPTLVPIDDKRPALDSLNDDFAGLTINDKK